MSTLKLESIAERVGDDGQLREFMKTLGGGFDATKLDGVTAHLVRPHVSDMSWALYSAIQAITNYYVAHWLLLSQGLDSRGLIANDYAQSLILAVAPEYKEYLETHGLSASYNLLERLETLLLAELQRIMMDPQQDKESVEQAANILDHVRGLNEKVHSVAVP